MKEVFPSIQISLAVKAGILLRTQSLRLCFWWPEFERQVKVDGEVSLLPEGEADEYFASRPRQSPYRSVRFETERSSYGQAVA